MSNTIFSAYPNMLIGIDRYSIKYLKPHLDKNHDIITKLCIDICSYIETKLNKNKISTIEIPTTIFSKHIPIVEIYQIKLIYNPSVVTYDNNKFCFLSYKDYSLNKGKDKINLIKSIFTIYSKPEDFYFNLKPLLYHFYLMVKMIFELLEKYNKSKNLANIEILKLSNKRNNLIEKIAEELFNDNRLTLIEANIHINEKNDICKTYYNSNHNLDEFITSLPLFKNYLTNYKKFSLLHFLFYQNANALNDKLSSLYQNKSFENYQSIHFLEYDLLFSFINYFVQHILFIEYSALNHFLNFNK